MASAEPRKPRRRIAVLGLPSVGKSTFVAALHGKTGADAPEPAQCACNKSTLGRAECNLDVLDLGGQPSVRRFWRHSNRLPPPLRKSATGGEPEE